MLKLFGIPYVESPSEAEAQCAQLELANLVDGIITDDSDVFLFGGQKVYRGVFKNSAQIDYFNIKLMEKEMGLNRSRLQCLSLFLGSDYTLGIRGVGIVNAVEILTAFEDVSGLKRFKEWALHADMLLDDPQKHYEMISEQEY